MEGSIYLCKKKKIMGLYILELLDNPKIKTKGASLEACKENICLQILEWNGDGEAVLEFVSKESRKTATGIEMYRALGYNDRVDILNNQSLFKKGICKKCKYALGNRNKDTLNLAFLPKNKPMVIGIERKELNKDIKDDFPRLFPHINIYHSDLIDLLHNELKNKCSFREVLHNGKESNYIELIPYKTIKNCAHKGAEYKKHKFIRNWRCTECGREELHFWTKEYEWNNNLIDPSDIKELPKLFFFDTGLHISLVVKNDVYMQKLKNLKILTEPVILLDKKFVEYPKYFQEPEFFDY